MQFNFSVFREGEAMAQGMKELTEIRERLTNGSFRVINLQTLIRNVLNV